MDGLREEVQVNDAWKELTNELSKRVALLEIANERQLAQEWKSLLKKYLEKTHESAARYKFAVDNVSDLVLEHARNISDQRLAKAEIDKQNELAVASERADHQNQAVQALYVALEDEHKREIEENRQLKADYKSLEAKLAEVQEAHRHKEFLTQDVSIAANENERQVRRLSNMLVDAETLSRDQEAKLAAARAQHETLLKAKQLVETDLLKAKEELRHTHTRIIEIEAELARNEPGSWGDIEALWEKHWSRVQRELEKTKVEDFSAVVELLNSFFERFEKHGKGWRKFQIFYLNRHSVFEVFNQYHNYVGEELRVQSAAEAEDIKAKCAVELSAARAEAEAQIKDAKSQLVANAESTKAQLTQELDLARKDLQNDRTKLAQQTSLAQSLQLRLDQLESSEKNLKNMNNDTLVKLQKDLQDANSSLEQLRTVLEDKERNIEQLQNENVALGDNVAALQNRADRLQQTIDNEISNMKEASTETLQKQQQEQLERLLTLQEQMETEKAKSTNLQRDLSTAIKEKEQFHLQMSSNSKELLVIQQRLQALENDHSNLSTAYQDALNTMKLQELELNRMKSKRCCVIM